MALLLPIARALSRKQWLLTGCWRQCKNVNLHVSKGRGALKLYKVSKAVDALNNREPERCKFMLWTNSICVCITCILNWLLVCTNDFLKYMFGLASTSVFGYQSTQKGKCFLQFCIYRGNITVQTFHENRLYYLSQTRVAVKDCLWFSCRGLVTFHWNDQINMLLSHLGEMTKLLPVAV